MTKTTMPLSELPEKHDDGDFLRTVAEAVLQLIMETDVEGVIGAGRHEVPRGMSPIATACLMLSLGSFAIREPLPGTPNMPGGGGGRIENGSAARAVR